MAIPRVLDRTRRMLRRTPGVLPRSPKSGNVEISQCGRGFQFSKRVQVYTNHVREDEARARVNLHRHFNEGNSVIQ